MVDLLLQMNWRAFVVTRLMTLQIMLEYADTLTLYARCYFMEKVGWIYTAEWRNWCSYGYDYIKCVYSCLKT